MIKKVLFFTVALYASFSGLAQRKESFNSNWELVNNIDSNFSTTLLDKKSTLQWQKVSLPNTVNIEPVDKKSQQWQGVCYYRKFFMLPAAASGKAVMLQFDAAMQEADVYLNGEHVFNHKGGYLPFCIDISGKARYGQENIVIVRLDNRDNKEIPPGKPLGTLDFNYYSGIYRNAWLIVKDKTHIADPIASNIPGGGGVLVRYEKVSRPSATAIVQADIKNESAKADRVQVKATLKNAQGGVVASSISKEEPAAPGKYTRFTLQLQVSNPKLWEPENPNLYRLSIEVTRGGKLVDQEVVRTGVRDIKVQDGRLYVNGRQTKIRGTNRHQEYPYIGNAASDNAQYRDAWKIKEAGFNFVRSSHYPQSPAFLDACDELGIMVMDAIPGWQYAATDSVFLRHSFQTIRDMMHRDRNHPSIIFWEASLNESNMQVSYIQKACSIVHQELPFSGTYAAGWMDTVYDVFLPARQHAKAPDYWKKYEKQRALLIAEYGDWEYYAQNAGFNQTAFEDLKQEERSSRQLRGDGEKRLLQQALNYQEAHNDNLYGNHLGDANWLMFDYNRGYADDIESSGIMDIMRLPKFAFYFYQSQSDPQPSKPNLFSKPMLFIANYWQEFSDTTVKIFSNCDEVELFLNGKSLGRQKPDNNIFSSNLKHPPFTFHTPAFTPGVLSASGFIAGKKVVETRRSTPEKKSQISLRVDYSGKDLQAGQNDVVFIYASVKDDNGTTVPAATDSITFTVTGNAQLIGDNPRAAEAGTATILLKAGASPGKITITATAKDLAPATLVVESK